MPFSSAHTKLAKRAAALAALKNSLLRSCHHTTFKSIQAQADKPLTQGMPTDFASNYRAECVKINDIEDPDADPGDEAWAVNVTPCVHKVSHGLNEIGQKAGIRTVLSAPNKVGWVCKAVNAATPKRQARRIKHVTRFVSCRDNVVYEITLRCRIVCTLDTHALMNAYVSTRMPYVSAPAATLFLLVLWVPTAAF